MSGGIAHAAKEAREFQWRGVRARHLLKGQLKGMGNFRALACISIRDAHENVNRIRGFCALPWSNTVILFREWLKISLFMILLQCPEDDRVFAAPVWLSPEEEGILGFFVGAKKPTERGDHDRDR